jgi:hypothetical protein
MVKNNNLTFKVSKKTKDNLIKKANTLKITMTQLIERIANEPIIKVEIEDEILYI